MSDVVIQMGHVARTSGATGAPGEQTYARGVAARAEALLPTYGLDPKVIFADPSSLSQYRGDIFFAVHYDSSSSPSAKGGSVGYRNAAGKQVADLWKPAYQRRGFAGGFRADNYTDALRLYYGVRRAVEQGNTRAVILEGGFGSNPTEGAWLRSAEGMTVGAYALVDTAVAILAPTPPVVPGAGAKPGVIRDGRRWLLRNALEGGPAHLDFYYGPSGVVHVVGDWNGNGQRGVGVFRDGQWFLRDSLSGGDADHTFWFGSAGDIPVVGDWNGDGKTTVGVRRGNRFLLKNSLAGGAADIDIKYGRSDDVPLVGDWNGDGKTTIGVRRGDRFLLRNSLSGGDADLDFHFGTATDKPVVGDWNGGGKTLVGVRRGSRWLLRNEHRGGDADIDFNYGRSDDLPVVW